MGAHGLWGEAWRSGFAQLEEEKAGDLAAIFKYLLGGYLTLLETMDTSSNKWNFSERQGKYSLL